jgi:hypothetical protein
LPDSFNFGISADSIEESLITIETARKDETIFPGRNQMAQRTSRKKTMIVMQ